jgi:hypothetical protein
MKSSIVGGRLGAGAGFGGVNANGFNRDGSATRLSSEAASQERVNASSAIASSWTVRGRRVGRPAGVNRGASPSAGPAASNEGDGEAGGSVMTLVGSAGGREPVGTAAPNSAPQAEQTR